MKKVYKKVNNFRCYTTLWGIKTHQNYIDRNLKMDNQTLIIFGTNISGTTGYQMTIYVLVAPNVCFCTTWKK